MLWLRMDVDPPMIEVVGPGMLSGVDKGTAYAHQNNRLENCTSCTLGAERDAAGLSKPVPWRAVFTTPSFLATAVCHATYAGGSYVLSLPHTHWH